MKTIIATLILIFLACSATATKNNGQEQGQQQGQIGINKSKTFNKSWSKSNARVRNNNKDINRINIGGDLYEESRIPVNTSYAPVVISTSDCLGSFSAGGQGQFLGLTVGGTTQSRPCNIREYSKMFEARNQPEIAFAILCQDRIVRKAVESAGKRCPSPRLSIIIAQRDQARREEACKYPSQRCRVHKKNN